MVKGRKQGRLCEFYTTNPFEMRTRGRWSKIRKLCGCHLRKPPEERERRSEIEIAYHRRRCRIGPGGRRRPYEEFVGGLESPDAARLDGARLAALRRRLLPEERPDERLAAEDSHLLVLLVPQETLVLRHVAIRVGRDRRGQRQRRLKQEA